MPEKARSQPYPKDPSLSGVIQLRKGCSVRFEDPRKVDAVPAGRTSRNCQPVQICPSSSDPTAPREVFYAFSLFKDVQGSSLRHSHQGQEQVHQDEPELRHLRWAKGQRESKVSCVLKSFRRFRPTWPNHNKSIISACRNLRAALYRLFCLISQGKNENASQQGNNLADLAGGQLGMGLTRTMHKLCNCRRQIKLDAWSTFVRLCIITEGQPNCPEKTGRMVRSGEST